MPETGRKRVFGARVTTVTEFRVGGIANAGVIDLKPFEAITEEVYDQHFSINTKGVFFGVQTIAPIMNNGGSILITSSLAATKVLPNHTAYAGS